MENAVDANLAPTDSVKDEVTLADEAAVAPPCERQIADDRPGLRVRRELVDAVENSIDDPVGRLGVLEVEPIANGDQVALRAAKKDDLQRASRFRICAGVMPRSPARSSASDSSSSR
jgi:hypothetical protein